HVLRAVHQRDEDRGEAGPRVRFDLLDLGVLADLLLDLARDQLLDAFGRRPRPGHQRNRLADGDVRVLPLRHPQVAVDAPQDREDQEDPGDVARLGEEARGVVRARNHFVIGMSVTHGITRTASPSLRRVAPITTTRSPGARPVVTATRLPWTPPSVTARA